MLHLARWPRLAAVVLLPLAAAMTPSPAAGATAGPGVSLSAEAGLGGLARSGRWMPVRIALENTGADITGELVVDTGSARTVQAITLAAPSRKRIEMYVRAPGADASRIRVSLRQNEVDVAAVDVPVRFADEATGFTLCVGGTNETSAPCTTTVESKDLPASWRGFDAADDVLAAPDVPNADALARWRASRALGAWVPPAVRVVATTPDHMLPRWVLGIYALLLLGAWGGARRAARVPARFYAIVLAVCVTGAVAVAAQGRLGPGSAVVVSQTAVVRSGATIDEALVEARGAIVFPSHERFEIRPLSSEMILTRPGSEEAQIAEDGVSSIAAVFGKNDRVEFEIDGFADLRTLQATRDGNTLRVTNAARFDLTDCDLPPGLSPRRIALLPSGDTLAIQGTPAQGDTAMRCAIRGELALLSSPGRRIEHRTSAVLVFDLAGAARR